jgi:diacylglycerol kinase
MSDPKPQQPLANSFRHAFAGMAFVLRTQRNAKIHLIISIIVIMLSIWLELSLIEWALIVIAIAIVWITESINTAMEAALDTFELGYHPLIKIGKDVGAAAVLIAAIAAVIIGSIVLAPPLITRIAGLLDI